MQLSINPSTGGAAKSKLGTTHRAAKRVSGMLRSLAHGILRASLNIQRNCQIAKSPTHAALGSFAADVIAIKPLALGGI